MKKILTILILSFLFLSCKDKKMIMVSQEEYKALKGDTIKPKYPKEFSIPKIVDNQYSSGIFLGSDQHEYAVFNPGNNNQVIMHYVDCELCAARKETSDAQQLLKIKYPLKHD